MHQPPPVHQVFEGHNFVVCNFVPRKVDYHPLSIPVPYYHSNVDTDEVMFYVGGDYEARKGSGIGLGSISLHPGGHAHGPQPGAIEASLGAEYFDELAVMVDTFRPLDLGEGGRRRRGPGVRLDLGGPRARRHRWTTPATAAPRSTPTPDRRERAEHPVDRVFRPFVTVATGTNGQQRHRSSPCRGQGTSSQRPRWPPEPTLA